MTKTLGADASFETAYAGNTQTMMIQAHRLEPSGQHAMAKFDIQHFDDTKDAAVSLTLETKTVAVWCSPEVMREMAHRLLKAAQICEQRS